MQIARIPSETRKPGGRHANERLRRAGKLPAVIYGHGKPPEHVAVSRHELDIALHQQQHVLELNLGGQAQQFLIKEVQYDHLQKEPIHLDLIRVDANERVRLKIPIALKGEAKGTTEGGEMVVIMSELEVECLALQIPEEVRHNVADMVIGNSVHVRDLTLPEGVVALDDPDETVCLVRVRRGVEIEAAPAEGAAETTAEPEVISKGKVETGEEEG